HTPRAVGARRELQHRRFRASHLAAAGRPPRQRERRASQALRRSAAARSSAVTPVRDTDGMDTELEDETSDPRVWKKSGWIACVIKNENDEGWAVSMTRMGDAEPVLV